MPGIGPVARTRCCWPAASPTPTRTAPGSASTTSRSRSTARRSPVHSYSKDGAMRIAATSPTRCTRRTPTAARRPTRSATDDGAAGTPTARWCAPRTRCTPRTTTGARPGTMVREVLDDAARDRLVDNIVGHLLNGVSDAGPAARLRVLAQRRQGPRRPDRGRRPCQAGRDGPQGRGAGQPGPGERAGQGLTARRGVHHHPAPRPDRARGSCPPGAAGAPLPRVVTFLAASRHLCWRCRHVRQRAQRHRRGGAPSGEGQARAQIRAGAELIVRRVSGLSLTGYCPDDQLAEGSVDRPAANGAAPAG